MVELSGIRRSFGSVEAVKGIDLAVSPGQCVALLGPNGAGKSTTLDMVMGLVAPHAGVIRVAGVDPVAAVAAGRVGAMLQTGMPLQLLSVRELVAMVGSLYPHRRDVEQVLALTGLDDIASRRTAGLSGGQAQRVRFACALVTGAGLLVLDEPTVALDVESRRAFWSAMRQVVADGTTVMFATHYLDEADANADRIVVMARGCIVADGPATQIRAQARTRMIRATLPGVGADQLTGLVGVVSAERHGDTVILMADDADRTLRALLAGYPDACDLEVRAAGLEDAFVELTGSDRDDDLDESLEPNHPMEVAR